MPPSQVIRKQGCGKNKHPFWEDVILLPLKNARTYTKKTVIINSGMYICFLFFSGTRISHKNRHIPEFLLYKFSHGLSLTSQHSNITPVPGVACLPLELQALRPAPSATKLLPSLKNACERCIYISYVISYVCVYIYIRIYTQYLNEPHEHLRPITNQRGK